MKHKLTVIDDGIVILEQVFDNLADANAARDKWISYDCEALVRDVKN